MIGILIRTPTPQPRVIEMESQGEVTQAIEQLEAIRRNSGSDQERVMVEVWIQVSARDARNFTGVTPLRISRFARRLAEGDGRPSSYWPLYAVAAFNALVFGEPEPGIQEDEWLDFELFWTGPYAPNQPGQMDRVPRPDEATVTRVCEKAGAKRGRAVIRVKNL